ncbi:MAG TPA: type II toxin-antitoxin system VapB family antitoxin [Longimicrobiaceae bacterium]|nr:type II toxin-antitoxin system VapB family antitoxin [Longimicrobiaceae bacterium]
MALNIKNPEAERLARQLAEATGESITQAVTRALREELIRKTGRKDTAVLRAQLQAIQERFNQRPVLDDRSSDEIIGYDEDGLPV